MTSGLSHQAPIGGESPLLRDHQDPTPLTLSRVRATLGSIPIASLDTCRAGVWFLCLKLRFGLLILDRAEKATVAQSWGPTLTSLRQVVEEFLPGIFDRIASSTLVWQRRWRWEEEMAGQLSEKVTLITGGGQAWAEPPGASEIKQRRSR